MMGYIEDVEYPSKTIESLQPYRDDQLLIDQRGQVVDMAVNPAVAHYRLVHDMDNSAVVPSGASPTPSGTSPAAAATTARSFRPSSRSTIRPASAPTTGQAPVRRWRSAWTSTTWPPPPRRAWPTRSTWYSTDGSTWLAAPLRQHGRGHYTATIPASTLGPGTSVSLHVRAADPGGNSVDQTLADAVAVTS